MIKRDHGQIERGCAKATTRGRNEMLTMSATRQAVSKRVGKSIFEMNELTDGDCLVALDRWRHMRILSGTPGAWPWTATMSGDDWKGPRRMRSVSSREKGPDILPAAVSSARYSLMTVACSSVEE